eukprot:2554167-Alexandrium_andersonii.AAC.1
MNTSMLRLASCSQPIMLPMLLQGTQMLPPTSTMSLPDLSWAGGNHGHNGKPSPMALPEEDCAPAEALEGGQL